MILIEAGQQTAEAFESKLLFAGLLRSHGHAVCIDAGNLPPDLGFDLHLEAAPYLAGAEDVSPDHLIVIGAERIAGLPWSVLRAWSGGLRKTTVVGRFADRQSMIDAQSKVAHATGIEPRLVDLARLGPVGFVSEETVAFVTGPAGPGPAAGRQKPRVRIWAQGGSLDDPATRVALDAMDRSDLFDLSVILGSTSHSPESGVSVAAPRCESYRATELASAALAGSTEIAVILGGTSVEARAARWVLDMLGTPKPVIDMTEGRVLLRSGAPVLRGPSHLAGLSDYLRDTVLPSRDQITRQAGASPWLQAASFGRLAEAIGLPVQPAEAVSAPRLPKAVFYPINGVGLGHAQRTLLIADRMQARDRCAFAVFPTCTGLAASRGFPVLPLLAWQTEGHRAPAHDMVTYRRLFPAIDRGDVLVFDGIYVFEALLRLISDRDLRTVWIRRGTWRASFESKELLAREKAFENVIVPGEAFPETDGPMTFGKKVLHVGPIVERNEGDGAPRADIRARLSDALKVGFDRLVVSMLGAGTASDRAAHLHHLCLLAERRPDTLHLIVVWPGSSVDPSLFGWSRSRVVSTLHASEIALAADVVVSAAGYNSFHEFIYKGIPAVFLPQTGMTMEDQERRARSASDRGLAVTVLPTDLMQLEREVTAFLDTDKGDVMRKALAEVDLPEPGTAAAAAMIDAELAR
jgi:Glycosyltransferase family 28 C-terminal domain